MIGLLIAFLLSWLILWLFVKDHITALGIIPTKRRLKDFIVGMIIMSILCLINSFGQAYATNTQYAINPNYSLWDGLNGTYWTIKAALLEELIFRGAILYVLIKKLGTVWGVVLSAIAFGIYHWFSYEMFGRGFVPMAYVFLLTSAGGLMFAVAFAKTKSIFASFGLHFGWIVISIVFLSSGPLGESMYIPDGKGEQLEAWPQLLFFLYQTLIVPGLIIWYFLKKYRVKPIQ